MKRLFYLAGFCLIAVSGARGDGTVVWPVAPVPAGTNSAITPVPQLGWFQHFQFNSDSAKKKAKIDLIFDGDSITDFWSNRGRDIWNAHYANRNAFDFGISGDRTENLLWRLQNGQVDGLHPRLIALMIGTNNLSANTVEEIAAGVKADIDEYFKHCPDATLLLQAIFPRGELPSDPNRAKIQAINKIISTYGDDKKIIYIDFGSKFLEADGTLSKDVMPDFLHPSPKGYQIWADAIQPEIDKILGGATP